MTNLEVSILEEPIWSFAETQDTSNFQTALINR